MSAIPPPPELAGYTDEELEAHRQRRTPVDRVALRAAAMFLADHLHPLLNGVPSRLVDAVRLRQPGADAVLVDACLERGIELVAMNDPYARSGMKFGPKAPPRCFACRAVMPWSTAGLLRRIHHETDCPTVAEWGATRAVKPGRSSPTPYDPVRGF